MTLRKKAVHGAKWAMLQNVSGQLIDFFVMIFLARLLGPKEFGLVAISTVLIGSLSPFVAQGLGAAITQRSELESKHLDSAFWSTFLMGCILAAVIAGTSKWWAIAFSEPELKALLPWLSINIVFKALTPVQEALLRRDLNFKVYAVRTLFAKSIGGTTAVIFAFYGFGVWSLVIRYLLTSFVSVFLLWGISNWRPSFVFSKRHFMDLFPFGMQIMANEILVFVTRNADTFLITYFLGSTALGFYNMAYRLMTIVHSTLVQTINKVGMPALARLQHNKARLWKAFYDISQLTALLVFPIFLGLAAVVPELIKVLLGAKWLQSIPVLQILFLNGMVHSMLMPMITVLVASGKAGLRLKLQTLHALVNLIGFAIAVHHGIIWVAVSFVTVSYVLSPMWLWAVTRVLKVKGVAYFKLLMRPFLLALVMVLGIYIVRWNGWDKLVIDAVFLASSVFGGMLVYTLMTLLVYRSAARKVIDILKTILGRKDKPVAPSKRD